MQRIFKNTVNTVLLLHGRRVQLPGYHIVGFCKEGGARLIMPQAPVILRGDRLCQWGISLV